jgi:hypothetical protein
MAAVAALLVAGFAISSTSTPNLDIDQQWRVHRERNRASRLPGLGVRQGHEELLRPGLTGWCDRARPWPGRHPVFAQASHAFVAALFGLTGTSRQCALDLGFAHPSGGFSGADLFAHPSQYTGHKQSPRLLCLGE